MSMTPQSLQFPISCTVYMLLTLRIFAPFAIFSLLYIHARFSLSILSSDPLLCLCSASRLFPRFSRARDFFGLILSYFEGFWGEKLDGSGSKNAKEDLWKNVTVMASTCSLSPFFCLFVRDIIYAMAFNFRLRLGSFSASVTPAPNRPIATTSSVRPSVRPPMTSISRSLVFSAPRFPARKVSPLPGFIGDVSWKTTDKYGETLKKIISISVTLQAW